MNLLRTFGACALSLLAASVTCASLSGCESDDSSPLAPPASDAASDHAASDGASSPDGTSSSDGASSTDGKSSSDSAPASDGAASSDAPADAGGGGEAEATDAQPSDAPSGDAHPG